MKIWIHFFASLSVYPDYFGILMLVSGFYCAFMAPLLFNCYVKPKIEKRFNRYLKPDNPSFIYDYFPFSHFLFADGEVTKYIFCKYMGWKPRFVRNPKEGTYYAQLNKMGYDISRATRIEIIFSIFNVVMMACVIVSSLVFSFYLYMN